MAAPLVVIAGPTATGKTALAVAVAQALEADIVSADSRLVYQGLDIGTAKPTATERGGVPHHALDVVPPTVAFTVSDYVELARPLLDEQLAAGRPLVITGGTGFWVKHLLNPVDVPAVAPNPGLRAHYQAMADTQGVAALHKALVSQDPQRAAELHPNDRVRVLRALEIVAATGGPVPRNIYDDAPAQYQGHPLLWLGLAAEPRWLAGRIEARVHEQMADGWLDEVRALMAAYGRQAHALNVTHGYPEWMAHLAGELAYEAALESIVIQVRQYARRQRTWLRRNRAMHWLSVDDDWPAIRRLPEAMAAIDGASSN